MPILPPKFVFVFLITTVMTIYSESTISSNNPSLNESTTNSNIIMSYYGEWGPYSDVRKYQVTGSKDMDTGKTVNNEDFNNQINNLNILAYANLSIYPDGLKKGLTPDPSKLGKIYFIDPWSDLMPSDQSSSEGICSNAKAGSASSPNHLLCYNSFEFDGNTASPDASYFKMGNFTAFAKLQNIKKIISISGGNNEKGIEQGAFINPDNFVNATVELIEQLDLDGVDFDYEPLNGYNAKNTAQLINLVTRLRTAFNNKGWQDKIITAAIYADQDQIAAFESTRGNWQKFAAQLNYVSIMGYDFHGSWDVSVAPTNFHSNLDVDDDDPIYNDNSIIKSVDSLLSYNVPANKILLGFPSFGILEGKVSSLQNDGLYQQFSEVLKGDDDDYPPYSGEQSYYNIVGQMLDNGYTEHEITKDIGLGTAYTTIAAWAFNPDSKTFVAYDNTAVIDTKAEYIKSKGLAGAMMWELISDISPSDPNDKSLLCHMAKSLWGVCYNS